MYHDSPLDTKAACAFSFPLAVELGQDISLNPAGNATSKNVTGIAGNTANSSRKACGFSVEASQIWTLLKGRKELSHCLTEVGIYIQMQAQLIRVLCKTAGKTGTLKKVIRVPLSIVVFIYASISIL